MVLQADVRVIDKRARDEATGEVMSLAGKLVGTQIGDKSQRMKPDKRQKRTRRGDVCGSKTRNGACMEPFRVITWKSWPASCTDP